MTMKLELPPEVQAALLAQARDNGLSPEAYAAQVLWERILGVSLPSAENLSPEQWMWEYRAWAHSHDADNFTSCQTKL